MSGRFGTRAGARADYEGQVLSESADDFVLDHLEEFVNANVEPIVKIIIEKHTEALMKEVKERGYELEEK